MTLVRVVSVFQCPKCQAERESEMKTINTLSRFQCPLSPKNHPSMSFFGTRLKWEDHKAGIKPTKTTKSAHD